MGKGGNLVSKGGKAESFSWEEVKKHTDRNDKWLVVEGEVYDISRWSYKHPGGSKVISHYAGQDATEAFKAFHNDLDFVQKYMKPIHIGKLQQIESKDDELKRDFAELTTTAEKMGLFKSNPWFYILSIIQLLVLESASIFLMYYYGLNWWTWAGAVIMLGTLQAQAGWSQHDYGHLSVFKNTKLNHYLHQFTMGIMKGASPDWWNHMHFQHHAKPNVMDKDPDVRLDLLFVFGDKMSQRAAKERKSSLPYNWQHRYFFAIGPPFLIPVYFQIMVFKYVISRKQWLDLTTMLVFYFRYAIVFGSLLGPFGFVKFLFLIRLIESHWFVWVSQSNHVPMEIDLDKERPWVPLQLHATCDVEQSAFNDWFTGHLNFQIEHHLFPTMPRHNLYKARPLVKSLCEKHGLDFQTKTLGTAFYDIYKELRESGELWSTYYDAYHL